MMSNNRQCKDQKVWYECGISGLKLSHFSKLNRNKSVLGCKRSWVQIPPVRPTQTPIKTKEFAKKSSGFLKPPFVISLHYRSLRIVESAVKCGIGNCRHLSGVPTPLSLKSYMNFSAITSPANASLSSAFFNSTLKQLGGVMDFIEITIKDFSNYIKRRDIHSPTWFAVDHNLLLHPDFFKVSGDEIKAFLWILGTAAHLNQSTIRVYTAVCAAQVQIDEAAVKSCIEKLVGKRWSVTKPSRKRNGHVQNEHASVTNPCTTEQNSTVQGSTEQNKTIQGRVKKNSSSKNSAKKAHAFIAAYCDRFKSRYGDNPEILGKDRGIATRVVKGWGDEKIELYLDAFFAMPDAYLVKVKHPLALFESKLNEIVVFAKSGKFMTSRQAQQADTSVALANQIQQIRNGEVR